MVNKFHFLHPNALTKKKLFHFKVKYLSFICNVLLLSPGVPDFENRKVGWFGTGIPVQRLTDLLEKLGTRPETNRLENIEN